VDCGCAAPETFARSATSGYLWAGPEDVWLYEPGAAQPRPIGTNIRPALKYGPKAMLYRWDGKYDPTDGHYKLAIPGENQSPGDSDPMQDQWWLDLREGAPQTAAAAQWYGPQQFISVVDSSLTTETGTYCMAVDTKIGHANILYGVERCLNSAGILSAPYGLSLTSYSARNSRDAQSAFTAGTTPNGTEIQGEIRTKQYDLGDPIVQKIFNAAELSVATGGAAQFQVTANMGNGVQVGLGTATSPGSGFIVGADLTDGDTLLADEPQAVTLYPTSATRYTGRTVQLYIQDTPTNVVSPATMTRWSSASLRWCTSPPSLRARTRASTTSLRRSSPRSTPGRQRPGSLVRSRTTSRARPSADPGDHHELRRDMDAGERQCRNRYVLRR
jgi:hypothetical protein